MKAHVHCVIVGFSGHQSDKNIIYENGTRKIVKNINAYLLDSEDIFIESRKEALCSVPEISKGFQATDNGYLILNEEEKEELLANEPAAERWIAAVRRSDRLICKQGGSEADAWHPLSAVVNALPVFR